MRFFELLTQTEFIQAEHRRVAEKNIMKIIRSEKIFTATEFITGDKNEMLKMYNFVLGENERFKWKKKR